MPDAPLPPTEPPATDAPRSLDELVRRYQRRVYAVIYRTTGNHRETDDLCQETFLQVFRSLPRFREGTDLDAWVYRIALHVSVDYLRRRAKDTRLVEKLKADPPATPPEAAPIDPELRAAVREALDRLPEDQRAVISLRVFEGLSHEEIARIQELPVATVRWRLFAARRKLDELLGGFL